MAAVQSASPTARSQMRRRQSAMPRNAHVLDHRGMCKGTLMGGNAALPHLQVQSLLPTFSEILLPSNISGACRPTSSQFNLRARIVEGPTDRLGVEQ